jgi:hypothetical protein
VIARFYSFGALNHQHQVLHRSRLPYLSEDWDSSSYHRLPSPHGVTPSPLCRFSYLSASAMAGPGTPAGAARGGSSRSKGEEGGGGARAAAAGGGVEGGGGRGPRASEVARRAGRAGAGERQADVAAGTHGGWKRDWRGRERSKWEKIRLCRGIFVNICQRGTTWHVTSASETHVARLGSWMEHLSRFRNPDGRFESLGHR